MTAGLLDQLWGGAPAGAPAVRLGAELRTRGDLRAAVDATAVRLRAAGVGAGDTVAVQVVPGLDYLTVVLAVLGLDACPLLLHHRTPEAERAACLAPFRIAADVRTVGTGRITRFEAAVETSVVPVADPDHDGSGPAVVQFTSGSTGRPKAVLRTEDSICAELAAVTAHHGWVGDGDVVLVLNSLVHSFGLFGAVLHALRVGAVLSFAPTTLPRDLAATIAAHRPVAVTGVPAHFALLTALPAGSLDGVRCCVSGGQLIAPAAHRAFVDRHGVPLGQAYGLTEIGLVAADFTGELAPAVGRISAHHDVRISGGEVLVRCPAPPAHPHTDEDDRWRDGWFATRDRGRLDEGVLTVDGRLDSLVAVGGLKVDLSEVEHVLLDCPGVTAAVVLFHDGTVRAVVESAAVTAGRVREHCAERLSPHKHPRLVDVVAHLPRTTGGKLVRDPAALWVPGGSR